MILRKNYKNTVHIVKAIFGSAIIPIQINEKQTDRIWFIMSKSNTITVNFWFLTPYYVYAIPISAISMSATFFWSRHLALN